MPDKLLLFHVVDNGCIQLDVVNFLQEHRIINADYYYQLLGEVVLHTGANAWLSHLHLLGRS